jgi:hypothetical protein
MPILVATNPFPFINLATVLNARAAAAESRPLD